MENNTTEKQNKPVLKYNDKIAKKQLIKAVIFFAVLYVIVVGATWIKFAILELTWSAGSHFIVLIGAALVLAALAFYLLYSRRELLFASRDLYAVGAVVAFSYIACIFFGFISIYAIPTVLAAFIIAPIARRRDAFIGNFFVNILLLITLLTEYIYVGGMSVEGIGIYRVLEILVKFVIGVSGGTIAAYTVWNRAGRLGYIVKSLLVGIGVYALIILGSVLTGVFVNQAGIRITEYNFFVSYMRLPMAFGAIAAFSPFLFGLMLQPVLERAFNLITDSRLIELTDHNSSLIKRLRLETPGTFSHSLAVASFAEMCASAIGENPYLARAAAYYHDVGKLSNPDYYKENQADINLHDELLPEVSADIIKAHTQDGLALCEKYRIPIEVAHVTVQHHGTLLIPVFYQKAKNLTDGEVDKAQYSYQGVTPRSKIAAIIMLADAGEAAIRSLGSNPAVEQVDELLSSIIEGRIKDGQFDYCDISLKELTVIKNTIIKAFGGLYHTRLKYPDGDK